MGGRWALACSVHFSDRAVYSISPQWAAFTWEGLQEWIKQQEGQGGGGGEEQEGRVEEEEGQEEEQEGKEEEEEGQVEDGSSFTLEEGESLVPLGPPRKTVRDIKQTWHQEGEGRAAAAVSKPPATEQTESAPTLTSVPGTVEAGVEVEASGPRWTREDFQKQSRKFNIDLVPRLLYSRGDMVELLISSNISRSDSDAG